MAEVPGIDRDRLCPANMQDHHADSSEWIQVFRGIQSQTAQHFCRRITAFQSDPAMGAFVKDQTEKDTERDVSQREKCPRRVCGKIAEPLGDACEHFVSLLGI